MAEGTSFLPDNVPAPPPEKLVQDLRIEAMTESIKVLRLLLSLQSMSSGCSTKLKQKISPSADEIEKHSEKYERLIGAIRVLEDDLQAERCKLKRLNTYSVYADIARFCFFTLGLWAVVTLFS